MIISIDIKKTVLLAKLAEFINDQNIELVLLEAIVESLDAASVEALCGENTHMATVNNAFNDALPITAKPSQPSVIECSLHYVENTPPDHDEFSYYRPVKDVLSFDRHNRYQQVS